MSPELLHQKEFAMSESEDGQLTRQSDYYALGLVVYEAGVHASGAVIGSSSQTF